MDDLRERLMRAAEAATRRTIAGEELAGPVTWGWIDEFLRALEQEGLEIRHRRVADYRPETPKTCDVCGEPTEVTGEERGVWHVYGPADRAAAAKYDIEGDGPVETIWNTYTCPNGHDGPVLIG